MPTIKLATGLSCNITGKRVSEPTPLTCWASATTAPITAGKRKASMTNLVSHTRTFLVVGWSSTMDVGGGPNAPMGPTTPGSGPSVGVDAVGMVGMVGIVGPAGGTTGDGTGGAHSGGGRHSSDE